MCIPGDLGATVIPVSLGPGVNGLDDRIYQWIRLTGPMGARIHIYMVGGVYIYNRKVQVFVLGMKSQYTKNFRPD